MTPPQPYKSLIVWCYARTRSTVLERPFLTKTDVEVIHEPLTEAAFFGPERTTVRYSPETIAEKYSQYSGATFASCWERAICPPAGKTICFTKELAKSIFVPKRHSERSPAPPNFAQDGNPTLIATEKLFAPEILHVFLIRRPSDYLVSLAEKLCSPIGDGWFNQEEIGIHETRRLYDLIASRQAEPPLVVDSDDLLANPGAVIKHLCQLVGIQYTPDMLTWEAGDAKATELFAKWKGIAANFFTADDTALNSTGIMPMLFPTGTDPPSPEVAEAIADNSPDFEYLKSTAHSFL